MNTKLQHLLKEIDRHTQHLKSGLDQGTEYKIWEETVASAPQVFAADRISIFIHDPSYERAWLKAGTGLIEDQLDIPLNQSLVGEVITTGEYRKLNEDNKQNRVHREVEAFTGYTTNSILCAPIRTMDDEKVAGAVMLLNKQGAEDFSPADLENLEILAESLRLAADMAFHDQDTPERPEDLHDKITSRRKKQRSALAIIITVVLGLIVLARVLTKLNH